MAVTSDRQRGGAASEVRLSIREGSYRLLFVLGSVRRNDGAGKRAFSRNGAARAFGKQPVERRPVEVEQFEHRLNPAQERAVRLARKASSRFFRGPPGTGKTTTLAQLDRIPTKQQRRVLITSTTHAALDQVLARLRGTRAGGRFARRSGHPIGQQRPRLLPGSSGSGHSEPGPLHFGSQRSRPQALLRQQQGSSPLMHRRPSSPAAQAHQLDFFAEAPGLLEARDLAPMLGPDVLPAGLRWSSGPV